ncbi:hypothetical protein Btru_014291 [Bulinus truncatus]|nr:hypothetical protein Btru_014291 [Bulinus truncatus]
MIALVITGAVCVLAAVAFVKYMTSNHGVLKSLGIEHPPTSWFFGNFNLAFKYGVFDAQKIFYNQYKDKKVYGWYDARRPVIVVRDLDIIKDIFVKNFNSFVDRHTLFEFDPPFCDNILSLRGDHWKRVRTIVSPTFSSGRIKRMSPHIERNAKILVENLQLLQERGEEVELRELSTCFTLDVIASTGFGLEINTLKDPTNKFVTEAKRVVNPNPIFFTFILFLPEMAKIFSKLGVPVLPKKSIEYFVQVVDRVMEDRKRDGLSGKGNDFMDLLMNAETEVGQSSGKDLTRSELYSPPGVRLTGVDSESYSRRQQPFHDTGAAGGVGSPPLRRNSPLVNSSPQAGPTESFINVRSQLGVENVTVTCPGLTSDPGADTTDAQSHTHAVCTNGEEHDGGARPCLSHADPGAEKSVYAPDAEGGADEALNKLLTRSPAELYAELQRVDPDVALLHHPNNKRKIVRSEMWLTLWEYLCRSVKKFCIQCAYSLLRNWIAAEKCYIRTLQSQEMNRALQVFYQTGHTMTSLLKEQHLGQDNVKSGPLRYPNPCILWIKCDQSVLDERLDIRVDDMIERGLIAELDSFYDRVQQIESQHHIQQMMTSTICTVSSR